ncbi:hypothetical protein MTR67_023276 [Solanum verrucosum]|uniref:Uncharacterized protein n=1 Tax=Solanum verrucosum TaxID=315347 RepID=A0AAF0R0N2_SOLVR|nr:hypothetical protein MTR67_023276 [Solanum verrucosum]
MQENVNEKDPDLLFLKPKPSENLTDNTTISSMVPDYYVGILYDESLRKYVPQNERDEDILLLTSHLKTLQKELQRWSDWANKKVMQATWRLSKDQTGLKMLMQEKEDAEKDHKEMQMLEENNMKRISEMEQELVNTYYITETAISGLNSFEGENVGLKKGMEALKLYAGVYATNMDKALAKEHEALKNVKQGTWRSAHCMRIYLLSRKKQLISNNNKSKPTSAWTSLRPFSIDYNVGSVLLNPEDNSGSNIHLCYVVDNTLAI